MEMAVSSHVTTAESDLICESAQSIIAERASTDQQSSNI